MNEILLLVTLLLLLLLLLIVGRKRRKKKNKRTDKKESFFVRLLNRILKLKYLKILDLSIGWVKGFSIKVEFFAQKAEHEKEK